MSDADAMDALRVAERLAGAMDTDDLGRRFVEEVTGVVPCAMAYRCTDAGDALRPLAVMGLTAPASSLIPLAATDHPLVYAWRQQQRCWIDDVHRVAHADAVFDAWREGLPHAALMVQPVGAGTGGGTGVVALCGEVERLVAWRDHPAWQRVLAIYSQLFERLASGQAMAVALDHEQRTRALREAECSRAGAARLLATEFVGVSATIRHIRMDMLHLAESSLSVLITGETGVGKDHAAWLIHRISDRNGKPFVPVNCAAIPQELIEAELFGAARGAYTGATQARQGLVAEADGGTLFLDEIGDMPLPLQGTLLRLLNTKTYRPLGTTRERTSDFRLICATHQPLRQRVSEGRFRQDLYYRIRQLSLHVPPLRERGEDMPALAAYLVSQYNRTQRARVAGLAPDALTLLGEQPFHGNVRELRSLILAACERTPTGKPITAVTVRRLLHDLAHEPPMAAVSGLREPVAHTLQALLQTDNLPEACAAFERELIRMRLRAAGGSRSKTAASLGVPKRTLARKCQQWQLEGHS